MSVKALWNDETGFSYSTELVLVCTICSLGLITGMTSARDGLITELADVGGAIAFLNQSYAMGGVKAHCAFTGATSFDDLQDFCDDLGVGNECNSRCLIVCEEAGVSPGESPHNG